MEFGVVTGALLLLLHLIAMGLIASHVFALPDPDQLTKDWSFFSFIIY
jgi:hypothetical protein